MERKTYIEETQRNGEDLTITVEIEYDCDNEDNNNDIQDSQDSQDIIPIKDTTTDHQNTTTTKMELEITQEASHNDQKDKSREITTIIDDLKNNCFNQNDYSTSNGGNSNISLRLPSNSRGIDDNNCNNSYNNNDSNNNNNDSNSDEIQIIYEVELETCTKHYDFKNNKSPNTSNVNTNIDTSHIITTNTNKNINKNDNNNNNNNNDNEWYCCRYCTCECLLCLSSLIRLCIWCFIIDRYSNNNNTSNGNDNDDSSFCEWLYGIIVFICTCIGNICNEISECIVYVFNFLIECLKCILKCICCGCCDCDTDCSDFCDCDDFDDCLIM